MFTVEIKINGTLIKHLYGHNTGEIKDNGDNKYECHLYSCEKKNITSAVFSHNPDNGINELVAKCLKEL